MKLITLGKIDNKFFAYILITIILETLSWLIRLYFQRNKNDKIKKCNYAK